ncbi:alpha/beta hydrolase [Fuchsiella alkaliacetigena]|uniref:alpha/beta hydrolase n=1 Tax=Fuchsiella alkaliacetigena TaxID=957042 RepID=UPI00200A34A1|nr:alpha/beta fold hydrolase [Fuchsiella alkaliacetigena]MCK8823624.1 alpha/beta fold hydrolase [Fuchsiella alkaliacetigena]
MKGKLVILVLVVLLGLLILFLSGPKVQVEEDIEKVSLPPRTEDLTEYLAQSEAEFADLIPGTEKKIIWADANKEKTPLSIIYLHGFSATRQETAPLADQVAEELGANLFYTRLTGHGRSGAAMGEAKANDWLNDAWEALEIGQQIGEEVVVIGTSTGGTLATWLALQEQVEGISALVLISPNFGPRDSMAELLTWPWAEQLLPLLLGEEYSAESLNPEHERYWTRNYPTTALFPMMALVDLVRESDLEAVKEPTLVLYSPQDQVVDAAKIEETFQRWGSEEKKLLAMEEIENPRKHVLAGDILEPNNTSVVKEEILEFIFFLTGNIN